MVFGDTVDKTINRVCWDYYLHIVHHNLISLCEHKLHKRWAREDLRFYILKHRAMDKWLSGVKKIHIAYSSAFFSSTGLCEKNSAPTFFQFKHIKHILTESCVNIVDAFRTTKYCAACGDRGVTWILQNIYVARKRVAGKYWYPIRGLKRCNNTYCSKFHDRDAKCRTQYLDSS